MIDALPLLLGPEGYQISRSVRLRSSASAYFNRTPASASNRKTWTWSGWVKRGIISGAATYDLFCGDNGTTSFTGVRFINDVIYVQDFVSSSKNIWWETPAVFRDPSAWYHIVVRYDTTQASSANSVLVYVNGVSQTLSFSAATGAYVQNFDGVVNSTINHKIGQKNGTNYFDGYLTEINFIDGQALTPASFGETNPVTGVWQPKKYTGTYGTNGFYLNFSDPSAATAAAIGKDNSGNGNNWTPNNISLTAGATYDSMLDVPTQWADGGNGRGNYCTLNPLAGNTSATVSNGNLRFAPSSAAGNKQATFGVTSGKWYWELTVTSITDYQTHGVTTNQNYATAFNENYGYGSDGRKWVAGSASSYGASYTTNDVIAFALDMDAGTLVAYKNNASQGTLTTGLTGTIFPLVRTDGTGVIDCNFGQRPFAYTPPSGFKALNTLNLPEPTILKGNQYFDVSLYTGTGAAQNIVNSGAMQPDLVWIKDRSFAASSNLLDSVRGPRIHLESNTTNAETTESAGVGLTAFNNNGFSLGTDNAGAGRVNFNGDTFVGWQWKEGATQGFDIVTYTGNGTNPGRTVAHNLGVAPAMIITKARSAVAEWPCYHKSLPISNTLYLNATYASSTYLNRFSAVSSTDFTTGSSGSELNTNGVTYVAYLFAAVSGFSSAFSYTGNGSADGPFIFLGFRPRWIMVKRTDSTGSWQIKDTARNPANLADLTLFANLANAEYNTFYFYDLLSNGFKVRGTDAELNANGGTYIGIAFAESPFKFSLGR